MRTPSLPTRRLATVLVVGAALAGVSASSASAESPSTVWLNPQTGELSFTGTEVNDWVKFTKQSWAGMPGGTAIVANIHNYEAANFSANCQEIGGYNAWQVACPASLVKKITFTGGAANDSFLNSAGLPSVAHGGPGVDYLMGDTANDELYGEAGNDMLYGWTGDDLLDGGSGWDQYSGGPGNDVVSYADSLAPVHVTLDNLANDGVNAEAENVPYDVEGVTGSPFGDTLIGNDKDNFLRGGDGPDTLDGKGGNDLLNGQAGNDTLLDGPGADYLTGGTDSDTLSYAGSNAPVYVYQDFKANDGRLGENDNVVMIENLTGSPYNDDLQGTSGNDHIDGGDGSDKIDAFFGDDVIHGGNGNDNIIGGPGMPSQCPNTGCTQFDTDTIDGGPGSDTVDYSGRSDDLTIDLTGAKPSGGWMEKDVLTSMENANGGSGNDVIYGNNDANSLTGGSGDDGIDGGYGNDYLAGDDGMDTLISGPGSNFVSGGAGNDLLVAADGSDELYGGPGTDQVSYWGDATGVVAHIGTGVSGGAGELDHIHSDVENLTGSTHDDQLYGDDNANVLDGLGGNDMITGNGGVDTLKGGDGDDKLYTVYDGQVDHTSCGSGSKDEANADKTDTIDADCEVVNKA